MDMETREYAVRICDGCVKLEGKQCNTPECAFCRKTTDEIKDLLEACQLRYVVDGEMIDLHESAVVNVETCGRADDRLTGSHSTARLRGSVCIALLSRMSEPIKPDEVVEAKKSTMPREVIECFNELIAEKWNGRSATIKQSEAANRIADRMNVDSQHLYDHGYMDVEDVFRAAGWKVEYDKPAYNETYPATFKFRKS